MALTVTVTPGLVAVDGETAIDAATLNALASPTVQVSGTIGGSTSVAVDNLTIDQAGSGSSLQVKDGGITAAKLIEAARHTIHQYAAGTLSGAAGSEVFAVTLSPAATAYTAGMVVRFKAGTAISGAVDVNVNALGAKSIFCNVTDELVTGDILQNQLVEIVYDGTNFQFVGAEAKLTPSKLNQATQGDVHQYAAGVFAAGVYAITLSPVRSGSYVAGEVVRFKADTANSGATDINLNSRGAANLFKNVTTELAAGDIPINAVVEAVYDGTNFQIRAIAGVIQTNRYTSSNQALPGSGGVITLAHGLGAAPRLVRWVLVCTTTDLGYAVSDEVDLWGADQNSPQGRPAFNVVANTTNLICQQASTTTINLLRRSAFIGDSAAITNGSWAIKVYAEL